MSESRGIWFLVGLSLGALAGILYAPQAGEQTRDLLSRKAEEGRDLMKKQADQFREKADQFREKAENWREQAGNLRETASQVRDQAQQYAERGRQAVTRQIDQFQAAVDAGKQAYRDASHESASGSDSATRL